MTDDDDNIVLSTPNIAAYMRDRSIAHQRCHRINSMSYMLDANGNITEWPVDPERVRPLAEAMLMGRWIGVTTLVTMTGGWHGVVLEGRHRVMAAFTGLGVAQREPHS